MLLPRVLRHRLVLAVNLFTSWIAPCSHRYLSYVDKYLMSSATVWFHGPPYLRRAITPGPTYAWAGNKRHEKKEGKASDSYMNRLSGRDEAVIFTPMIFIY